MATFDAEEQEIVDYLRSFSELFVSSKEIARRAGGKKKFKDNPYWATKALMRLVERGVLEGDSSGRYRIKPEKDARAPRRWLSPQMRRILEESGKDVDTFLAEQAEKKEEKPAQKDKTWKLNEGESGHAE
jgi:hypothetical protein